MDITVNRCPRHRSGRCFGIGCSQAGSRDGADHPDRHRFRGNHCGIIEQRAHLDIEVGNRSLRRNRRCGKDEHVANEYVFVSGASCATFDFEVGGCGFGWDWHANPLRRLVAAHIALL